MVQYQLPIIIALLGIAFFPASVISCQVYPSEYAYQYDSVSNTESNSANCRRYQSGNLPSGLHPEDYIHCNGTQLELTDSNLGQEQYQTTDYYVWTSRSGEQLLFIFPTRVSLTTITLHYYSDSVRGLPRLRFYAVPDDFSIWNAITTSYPSADVASVPPSKESAGRRNIRININFNTKKVQMYKFSSNFNFAVCEVEFFNCTQIANVATTTTTTAATSAMASSSTSSIQATSDTATTLDFTEIHNDTKMPRGQSKAAIIAIGISTAILLILSSALTIIVVVLIRNYRRRSAKQELYNDSSYSTLNRDSELQVQPQYTQQNSNELYNQIHLSPFTGQTEFISKSQNKNINSHPTHPDTENSVINASAPSQTNSPLTTYAAIDKSKKKKLKKDDTKHTAAEKYTQKVSSTKWEHTEGKENSTKRSQKSLDDMYASDQKDREKLNSEQERNPPHSVEELYTAVKKKPKGSSVPANEQVSQAAEDLYTAVMKKPKENSVNDEIVPSIPLYTVEELYTAVHKTPKNNKVTVEDEEQAPPIPLHTAEDTF